MKQCNVCHLVQPDEGNFCTRCGSSSFTLCYDSNIPETEVLQTDVLQTDMPETQTMPMDMPETQTMSMQDGYVYPGGYVYPAPMAPVKKKNTGLIIGLSAGGGALVLLAVAIILFTVVLNPVNRFMNKLEKEDYTGAADLYYGKIVTDMKKSEKVYTRVYAQQEELLQQYRDEEIDYDTLMSKLYGIEMTGALGQEIYEAFIIAENLYFCRENFTWAEEAYYTGDYVTAIQGYREIIGMDFENAEVVEEHLSSAVTEYRAEILAQAQAYMEEANYTGAMYLLQDALYVLVDDPALLAAQEECLAAEHDYIMLQYIEEARAYLEIPDFVSALACLDEYIAMFPEETVLQEARTGFVAEFEAYVAVESLRLAKTGEYQHAASLAASGLNYFTSPRVTELLNIYKSYIPVLLGEMEIFQNNTDGGSWATKTNEVDAYQEDNYGNVYANSLTAGCGDLVYLVNFKYQTFSGTVAFPKGLESDSARESATLTIYGDGTKIAEFVNMNGASAPQEFNLDISTYERITLEWTCKGDNVWRDWGDFATIFDGLLIPIPLELPESP